MVLKTVQFRATYYLFRRIRLSSKNEALLQKKQEGIQGEKSGQIH